MKENKPMKSILKKPLSILAITCMTIVVGCGTEEPQEDVVTQVANPTPGNDSNVDEAPESNDNSVPNEDTNSNEPTVPDENDNSGSDDDISAGSTPSCNYLASHQCMDYTGVMYTIDQVQLGCPATVGEFSATSSCDEVRGTSSLNGRCHISEGTGFEAVQHLYENDILDCEQQKSICTAPYRWESNKC